MVFKKDALDYLRDVRSNNSREWFLENKERYNESLIAPLKEFVEQLTETMLAIDPEFEVEPRINKTISRINRDTRFSQDKSLYKNKVWITFKKQGADKVDYPTYFFELTPSTFMFGMGFYGASIKSMNAVRDKIDTEEKEFINIINEIQNKDVFQPEGELYKKSRYNGKVSSVSDWYNRKNLYLVYHSENIDEIFGDEFIEILKEHYQSLSPIYHFLTDALKEVE